MYPIIVFEMGILARIDHRNTITTSELVIGKLCTFFRIVGQIFYHTIGSLDI